MQLTVYMDYYIFKFSTLMALQTLKSVIINLDLIDLLSI